MWIALRTRGKPLLRGCRRAATGKAKNAIICGQNRALRWLLTQGLPRTRLPTIVSAPLKLYVKTWCPWCITARQALAKLGFKIEEIDVEADRAAYAEMIRLSGQTYTPTLCADGKLLADFGPDELKMFLQKNHIEP
jgi:glutaredoxin 3